MKVEFLEESQDGSVIRLFDFSYREVTEFKFMLDQLIEGHIKSFDLEDYCNINLEDNCHLRFVSSLKDRGIQRMGNLSFECALTRSSLSSVSELVGAFAFHPAEGYEWLDETSKIALLISPEESWSLQESAA